MARVDWDCARGVGNEGAINGAFDAGFAPEFCSTRRFLGALERARAGSCENAVVHPVRIVEEKAEHVGEREALCDQKKERASVCHSRGACACAGRGCTALS